MIYDLRLNQKDQFQWIRNSPLPPGKTISEVIEAGRAKLGSVPSGGAVAAAPAAGGAAAAADAAPAAAEEPAKEEKKDDSDEESDDDMGFGLFD